MHAIPTMYGGTQFRSRLEARWAAFFDLLEWPWDYEPIDLRGYIPDFLIRGKSSLLIEVKGLDGPGVTRDAQVKINRSGWAGKSIIVNSQPDSIRWRLGACFTCPKTRGATWRAPGCYPSEAAYGVCLSDNVCLLCEADTFLPEIDPADLTQLWREAGNRVQWRSPRSRA